MMPNNFVRQIQEMKVRKKITLILLFIIPLGKYFNYSFHSYLI